jgi:hypothetical protein
MAADDMVSALLLRSGAEVHAVSLPAPIARIVRGDVPARDWRDVSLAQGNSKSRKLGQPSKLFPWRVIRYDRYGRFADEIPAATRGAFYRR